MMIESLRGVEITKVAAGGAHSAAISAQGELYTWGKGRYGRLGHGDSDDQMKPKLVDALVGETCSPLLIVALLVLLLWMRWVVDVSTYTCIVNAQAFLCAPVSCVVYVVSVSDVEWSAL